MKYVHGSTLPNSKHKGQVPTRTDITKMLKMVLPVDVRNFLVTALKARNQRAYPCGSIVNALGHVIRDEDIDDACLKTLTNVTPHLIPEGTPAWTPPKASTPEPSTAPKSATTSSTPDVETEPLKNSTKPSSTSTPPVKKPSSSSSAKASSPKRPTGNGSSFFKPPTAEQVQKKMEMPRRVVQAPAVRSTPTKAIFASEDEMLFQMTESTATRVLEGLKLIRQVADDHDPKTAELLIEAYEVAALALIEAMDKVKGVRAITGLSERQSAHEKVKILSARNFKEIGIEP